MEKLLESIGKILKAIISSEFFWLVVAALAAFSLAFMLIEGEEANIIDWGIIKIKAVYVLAIAAALLVVKVVSWVAQQKELIEILSKIVQGIFSAQTFWLIVIALAIFGGVAMALNKDILPIQTLRVIAIGAIALILAKVVVWIVKRVVDQYFA